MPIQSRFCSAKNCFNSFETSKELSFFRFPKDKLRCKIWLTRAGRMDLVGQSARERLNGNYLLCGEHFNDNQFVDKVIKNSLNPNALPSLFPTYPSGSSLRFYNKASGAETKRKRLKATAVPSQNLPVSSQLEETPDDSRRIKRIGSSQKRAALFARRQKRLKVISTVNQKSLKLKDGSISVEDHHKTQQIDAPENNEPEEKSFLHARVPPTQYHESHWSWETEGSSKVSKSKDFPACNICKTMFANPSELAAHAKSHEQNDPAFLGVNDETKNSQSSDRISRSEGQGSYTTEDNSPNLIIHQGKEFSPALSSKKKSVFTCAICQVTFTSREKLAAHAKSHSSKNMKFKHFVTYTGEMVFSCKDCRQVFTEMPTFCTHRHTGNPCALCQSKFRGIPDCATHETVRKDRVIVSTKASNEGKPNSRIQTVRHSLEQMSEDSTKENLDLCEQAVNDLEHENSETYILPVKSVEGVLESEPCEIKKETCILSTCQENDSHFKYSDESVCLKTEPMPLGNVNTIQIKMEPPDDYFSTMYPSSLVQVKMEKDEDGPCTDSGSDNHITSQRTHDELIRNQMIYSKED